MAKDRFKPLVIVMVKAPLPGRVKTRLASEIGSTEALRFYRVTAAKIIRTLARDTRWRLALAVAPDNYRRSRFWSGTVTILAQGTGGLGDRMARILSLPSGCPIVLIGSDIPGIAPSHIASAIRKVTGTTLVIGPSGDGGFWLIARHARPLRRGVFDNVRWSTEFAMADTVRNWAGPVDFVPSLWDVDTIEDYLRWRRHSR